MKLEIMKVLSVLIEHITLNDNSMLQTFSGPKEAENLPSDCIRAAEDEYGYFVWAGDTEEPELLETYFKELMATGMSKDFVEVLKMAVEHDCTYVRLARDGPVYENLNKHSW